MSTAAAQSAAFFDEVSKHGLVWAIRDEGGFPAPRAGLAGRAMPFWSLESRAHKVIGSVDAYRDFEPHKLTLAEFMERWLPGLDGDGLLVGINWSGFGATGYDIKPDEVRARFESLLG